jgi:hypothetical protein
MTPAIERRSRRSPWASEALHLQLLRAVQEQELQSLVLSDTLGHVWAASSRSPSAPSAAPGARGDDGPDLQRGEQRGVPWVVQRLRVGPAVLYLSAQGATDDLALQRTVVGVERILGELI